MYIPKTAIAGDVAQIPVFSVGCPEKDALPGMRRYTAAEAGAIFVIAPSHEALYLFKVRFFHARHLADLMNPETLQLFCCGLVVHVRQRQTVREPFAAQLGNEGAFAFALRAIEDQHIVKFCSGSFHAPDGGAENFPDKGAM